MVRFTAHTEVLLQCIGDSSDLRGTCRIIGCGGEPVAALRHAGEVVIRGRQLKPTSKLRNRFAAISMFQRNIPEIAPRKKREHVDTCRGADRERFVCAAGSLRNIARQQRQRRLTHVDFAQHFAILIRHGVLFRLRILLCSHRQVTP